MCLTVTHVPYSKADGLIVPCFKTLNKSDHESGRFFTPAMSCKVPDDGWMFVDDKYPSVWREAEIGYGGIHAYTTKLWSEIFPVFAFGVIAYECFSREEEYEELCCHALYIPKADCSLSKRKETVLKIEKLLKKRTLTADMVGELHPDLRKLL